ncbi:MAG: hypothetical protein RIQ60_942 [Pseudomonadota bacterium]|jgi:uncharacterized protein (DUF4213/DUF364 family)
MSTAAHELLTQLEILAPALGAPRVRALHLPPEPADGSRRGEFAALELDDGAIGLAYVLLEGTLARLRTDAEGWNTRLAGRPALEVARAITGAPGLDRTIAWAAAHALAHSLARRAAWAPPPAGDSLAGLAPGPGDHLGLVGLFGPLMDRLVASGARITVLELRDDLAGPQPGYEVTLDPQALAGCNKVLSTGTLLLNDTLDAVLAHTRHAQRVALVGPTVSGLPDVLFSRGVHVVGGTWIEDGPALLDALRAGQDRAGAARKFTLERGDWPGWRSLLARLG